MSVCQSTYLLNDAYVELDRALSSRYRHNIKFRVLYIDLDDTVIVNVRVNASMIMLIVQCLTHGRQVRLLP